MDPIFPRRPPDLATLAAALGRGKRVQSGNAGQKGGGALDGVAKKSIVNGTMYVYNYD